MQDGTKHAARALIALVVAYLAAAALKAMGAGKWVVAGVSGAAGNIAALAVVA
jgi:hypothetical protein